MNEEQVDIMEHTTDENAEVFVKAVMNWLAVILWLLTVMLSASTTLQVNSEKWRFMIDVRTPAGEHGDKELNPQESNMHCDCERREIVV